MLSLEYLLEEAKNIGVPVNKKRAVIREYLQNILLSGIYRGKGAKKMFFLGGTALRFCCRLPRFSEDLDFNASSMSFEEFKEIVDEAKLAVEKEGFKTNTKITERKKIFTASIDFPNIMQDYGITDARGHGLMVKLEVNEPTWPYTTRPVFLSYYGINYMANMLSESSLISEKLCALIERKRGRDVYDLLFMLRKKYPFDERILRARGYDENIKKLINKELDRMDQKELKRLAKQIQPFLFKEVDTIQIENAKEYAKKYLEAY
jgi:predicted nucleotidyltransferase component of viral defense system